MHSYTGRYPRREDECSHQRLMLRGYEDSSWMRRCAARRCIFVPNRIHFPARFAVYFLLGGLLQRALAQQMPVCTGNYAHADCLRIDNPTPPDTCLLRDPVTNACLAISPNYAYPSTTLSQDPLRSHVTLGEMKSCDATDPLCVPGGIHTQKQIDWSQVEGAEFMVVQRRELEGSMNIFVDASTGNDQSGGGTRESPFRSMRAALKRWLMPGKCSPYCGSSNLARSGTVLVRPGVYAGPDNREIQLLVSTDVSVTVRIDSDSLSTERVRGVSTSRDPSVDVRIEGGAYWLKASGGGTLSLLSMSGTQFTCFTRTNALLVKILTPDGAGIAFDSASSQHEYRCHCLGWVDQADYRSALRARPIWTGA